ncbi:hypothetical protein KY290_025986 [Solanum tuberosum]|uniref:Uncharacterized protein n=1 Tax=Solanum tuberosum TaxID=4113 RepID=A0ABQ7UV51_SOLTU|nr:hypothetical protein KY289_025066 [Solanum tuberosum]KAH0673776.1 hypothetical protein KY284_024863 [Solanum tuberosum]KAH0677062.1 hypothetical protein KY285_024863 [Solanum tuberosum]KAH0755716.1 hypothetical protein KY290_025986 [Solanum tuberosum]
MVVELRNVHLEVEHQESDSVPLDLCSRVVKYFTSETYSDTNLKLRGGELKFASVDYLLWSVDSLVQNTDVVPTSSPLGLQGFH